MKYELETTHYKTGDKRVEVIDPVGIGVFLSVGNPKLVDEEVKAFLNERRSVYWQRFYQKLLNR